MSKVIPKEQLTAYQRWELAAFDESHARTREDVAFAAEQGTETGAESTHGELSLAFPTAEDLERIHQEAWQEGYDLGRQEGLDAGRQAGFEAGKQEGEAYARQLRALAEALETERIKQDEAVAQEVLALALAVAQQVVSAAVHVNPELILASIREALLSLPSLSGHHRVVVHPESASVVKEWLAQEHSHLSWKVVEDTAMTPGGFRFESGHSELDATLPTRWREIAACLGADISWLS